MDDDTGTSTSTSQCPRTTDRYFAVINLFAYIVNVLLTYGIGVRGVFYDLHGSFKVPTNAELSAKYQTLVTPSGVAFSIWSLIFVFQLLWTLKQFYRPTSSPTVSAATATTATANGTSPLATGTTTALHSTNNSMKYKYVWVVVAQCVWTIVFSLEWITVSAIAMYVLLFTLFRIVWMKEEHKQQQQQQQHQLVTSRTVANDNHVIVTETDHENNNNHNNSYNNNSTHWERIGRYFMEVFPFTIHCGWICVACVVNTNVALISWNNYNNSTNNNSNSSTTLEFYVALISLYIVMILGAFTTIQFKFITIPAVSSWGLYWIYSLLANKTPTSILERYTTNQISIIEITSYCISISILVCIAIQYIQSTTTKVFNYYTKTTTSLSTTSAGYVLLNSDIQ